MAPTTSFGWDGKMKNKKMPEPAPIVKVSTTDRVQLIPPVSMYEAVDYGWDKVTTEHMQQFLDAVKCKEAANPGKGRYRFYNQEITWSRTRGLK